jgi:hypothetical protein
MTSKVMLVLMRIKLIPQGENMVYSSWPISVEKMSPPCFLNLHTFQYPLVTKKM